MTPVTVSIVICTVSSIESELSLCILDPLKFIALDHMGSLTVFNAYEDDSLGMVISRKKPSSMSNILKNIFDGKHLDDEQAQNWLSVHREELYIQERAKYDAEILDIHSSLHAIQVRVKQLLDTNSQLPENERLDEADFELDADEKQRRVNAGQEKETKLLLEIKAWQVRLNLLGFEVISSGKSCFLSDR